MVLTNSVFLLDRIQATLGLFLVRRHETLCVGYSHWNLYCLRHSTEIIGNHVVAVFEMREKNLRII